MLKLLLAIVLLTLAPSLTSPETTQSGTSAALPLSGVTIAVDAGHQRYGDNTPEPIAPGSKETRPRQTTGTQGVATNVPEYEVNLIVSLRLKELLTEQGAVVVMTRESHDVDTGSLDRAAMMNESGADLAIRIHCNGSENRTIKGAMTLVPSHKATEAINAVSEEYGNFVHDSFIKATGAKDLGVIKRDDLVGFNYSTVPIVLIEMGFMSNPEEDKLLCDADYQEKIAQGLLDGIVRCFE